MRTVLILIFASLAVGCGQQVKNSSKFSKASSECLGNVAKGSYLISWKDGRVTVENAESDEAFLSDFVASHGDQIKYAEPNYNVRLDDIAPMVDHQPIFADNWGQAQIHADALWQQNLRAANVVVAVIDTGVDITHPSLASRILTNPGESGARANNGVDDDRNGYVDDYYGYDWIHGRGLTGDNQYHGTHVAGIIAAEHQDTVAQGGTRVQGVAPQVKILPLAFLDSQGGGTMDAAVSAIDYALLRGAKVINASWGGTACSRALRDKISGLQDKGVIFVSAAGNSGSNVERFREFPAALNLYAQFTVGSSTQFDSMADHSNYGEHAVHIFAPGLQIMSTVPGGGMASLTGTSMATPFVTGAIALLLGAEPTAQIHEVRRALYESAYHNQSFLNASRGRLDLANALSTLRAILQQ